MTTENEIALGELKKLEIFKGVCDEHMERCITKAKLEKVGPKTPYDGLKGVLFTQNSTSNYVRFLTSGEIHLLHEGERRILFRVCFAGEALGVRSSVKWTEDTKGTHSLTAQVIEETTFIQVPIEQFNNLLEHSSQMFRNVAIFLANLIRDLNREAVVRTRGNAKHLFVYKLAHLQNRKNPEAKEGTDLLELSQKELRELCGFNRSAMDRIHKALGESSDNADCSYRIFKFTKGKGYKVNLSRLYEAYDVVNDLFELAEDQIEDQIQQPDHERRSCWLSHLANKNPISAIKSDN